jgi:uncharacterized protein YcbX
MGTVTALYRYPVKSMLGEAVIAAAVTENGLSGDRVYAVLGSVRRIMVGAIA